MVAEVKKRKKEKNKTSIIQGSAIGPASYVVHAGAADLQTV